MFQKVQKFELMHTVIQFINHSKFQQKKIILIPSDIQVFISFVRKLYLKSFINIIFLNQILIFWQNYRKKIIALKGLIILSVVIQIVLSYV